MNIKDNLTHTPEAEVQTASLKAINIVINAINHHQAEFVQIKQEVGLHPDIDLTIINPAQTTGWLNLLHFLGHFNPSLRHLYYSQLADFAVNKYPPEPPPLPQTYLYLLLSDQPHRSPYHIHPQSQDFDITEHYQAHVTANLHPGTDYAYKYHQFKGNYALIKIPITDSINQPDLSERFPYFAPENFQHHLINPSASIDFTLRGTHGIFQNLHCPDPNLHLPETGKNHHQSSYITNYLIYLDNCLRLE
jgi:hypothetical protein